MLTQKLNPATLTTSEIEEKMENLKNYENVRGFFKELVAPTLQGLLEAKLENHYTTNSIENLNRQLRSVTKTTVIFPHDAP